MNGKDLELSSSMELVRGYTSQSQIIRDVLLGLKGYPPSL